jgi:hypothetical protein
LSNENVIVNHKCLLRNELLDEINCCARSTALHNLTITSKKTTCKLDENQQKFIKAHKQNKVDIDLENVVFFFRYFLYWPFFSLLCLRVILYKFSWRMSSVRHLHFLGQLSFLLFIPVCLIFTLRFDLHKKFADVIIWNFNQRRGEIYIKSVLIPFKYANTEPRLNLQEIYLLKNYSESWIHINNSSSLHIYIIYRELENGDLLFLFGAVLLLWCLQKE